MFKFSPLSLSLSYVRNKDGFLTMGEIKLVNKSATKKEIQVIHEPFAFFVYFLFIFLLTPDSADVQETIEEYDFDKDGKLNTAEYHQVMLQVRTKVDGYYPLAS